MGTTRVAHIGYTATADFDTNRLAFDLPLNMDGFDVSNRSIGIVNLNENGGLGEVIAFTNPVLDLKGDLISCEIPNLSSVWPNAATDRYCQAMAGGFSLHGNASLAETAAAPSGDVIINTPKAIADGGFMYYAQDPQDVWGTVKNLVLRSYTTHLKYGFLLTARKFTDSPTGVFIEDAHYRANGTGTRQIGTQRRCYLADFSAQNKSGGSSTPGDLSLLSCIWALPNNIDQLVGASSGIDIINVYHCATALAFSGGRFVDSAAADLLRVRNSIIIASGFDINPFGTGDFQDTDYNWTTYDGTSDGTAGWTGSNNKVSGDITDLKLSADNNVDPSFWLNPYLLPKPGAGSEVVGLGTSDAAVTGLRENRRDFWGFLRPTTGVQTIGPINLETLNGGVVWPGYSAPDNIVTNTLPITATVAIS